MAATYTVKQVAELLEFSTNSIYSFLKAGRIKGIRVGKGRFRIPKYEVDRLLMVTKKTGALKSSETDSAPIRVTVVNNEGQGVRDVAESAPIEQVKLFGFVHVGTLNIFDWFIGVSAVISGLGLFLMGSAFETATFPAASSVQAAARTLLIGSGIGILITNITGKTANIWYRAFRALLGTLGIMLAVLLLGFSQDIDGSLIYGGLGFLVFVSLLTKVGGALLFTVYISILTLATVLSVFVGRAGENIGYLSTMLAVTSDALIGMFLLLIVLYVVALWQGYFKSKQLFWLATWLAAFWYFVVAFVYAADSYWSRSFFFMVVGMTSLFISPWESLASIKSRRADLFSLGVFSGILGILLASVAIVYMMQVNNLSTIKRENTYKVALAKEIVVEALGSIQNSLVSAADNQDFVNAVAEGDVATIVNTERIIYESNPFIRRVILLDKDGMGVNLYPEGTFDQRDLSFRDYFQVTRDTKRPFISDLFTALVDRSNRPVVSTAVPILAKDGTFLGVLNGSINLEVLGARLSKLVVPSRKEYIVMLDSRGKRLVHGNPDFVGTDTEPRDPMRAGIEGMTGSAVGQTYNGYEAVIVYAPVSLNGFNWSVGIKSPVREIYRMTGMTNLTLFGVIIASVILAGIILQSGFFYHRSRNSGSSP